MDPVASESTKVPVKPERDLPAEFEVEPVFHQFINRCPSPLASRLEVCKWIQSWFDVSGAFVSDIALPVFIEAIFLDGDLLHVLKNRQTLFKYLDACNKVRDGRLPWYNEEIMNSLTDYMWYAKENRGKRGKVLVSNPSQASAHEGLPAESKTIINEKGKTIVHTQETTAED